MANCRVRFLRSAAGAVKRARGAAASLHAEEFGVATRADASNTTFTTAGVPAARARPGCGDSQNPAHPRYAGAMDTATRPYPVARRPRCSRATAALLLLAGFGATGCASTASAPDTPPPQGTPLAVSLRTHEGSVDVYAEGSLFATVRFGDEAGPCVFPLNSAGGALVTRGFPIAPGPDDTADHPHHRSLWFAHGDVSGVDFWHDGGKIETLGFEVELVSKSVAVVELTLLWRANDGRPILREARRLTFHAEQGLRWVEARHELRPAEGDVVFGDTKEGTFALRVAPTLQVEGPVAKGVLIDSAGRSGAEVWGKRATWIAATGPVRGDDGVARDVTVGLLEHPSNPGAPTWWHARTYGLLAANPFGKAAFEGRTFEEDGSVRLGRTESLVLRYRVILGDGPLTPERLEAEAQRYAGDPDEGLT